MRSWRMYAWLILDTLHETRQQLWYMQWKLESRAEQTQLRKWSDRLSHSAERIERLCEETGPSEEAKPADLSLLNKLANDSERAADQIKSYRRSPRYEQVEHTLDELQAAVEQFLAVSPGEQD